jgi:hypothetical protein
MKLVIKKNAVECYRKQGGMYSPDYAASLRKIEGTIVDVETDHLFEDQYNIVQENLRVFDYAVESIIDDARIGRQHCQYCGKHSAINEKTPNMSSDACPKCGTIGYLTPFKPFERIPDDPGPSEYERKAQAFLTENKITFKAVRTNSNPCPLWCDGKHIHGDQYRVTLRGKGRSLSFMFWNSLADMQAGRTPKAYDVLAVLEKNDPGDFAEFCGNMGFDTDSRKAGKTYKLVLKQWEKVKAFFSDEELEQLQEIN